MKAFKVIYSGADYSGAQMYVIAKDKDGVEEVLGDKSHYKYIVGSTWCKIDSMTEVPMSQVKLTDLSIVEFMRLTQLNPDDLEDK